LASSQLAMASRLLPPRSGLERSDFVPWPAASDIAAQPNGGFRSNCGSGRRTLEMTRMTGTVISRLGTAHCSDRLT
jgi:hypothetical protein